MNPAAPVPNIDVLVIGGGPAGVVAAVQAARAGSRTLLVERSARLGGVTVNAGINHPSNFNADGAPVVRGIGWELVQRAIADDGELRFGSEDSPGVDIDTYAHVCDEAVLEAGADLLLHTMPARVTWDDDAWSVELCGIDGLHTVRAHAIVDATGDANVVGMAGLPRRALEASQPATLDMRLVGYDLADVDLDAVNAAFLAAIDRGDVKASDGCWFLDPDLTDRIEVDPVPSLTRTLRVRGRSCNHITVDADVSTARGRTALEVEARRSIHRLRRFLRTQPGLERVRLADVRQEVGVRETGPIVGRATVTREDYTTGRSWPDALCFAHYPVDRHGIDAYAWDFVPLDEGIRPQVPLGALLPVGGRNIMVAGRSVSSDPAANGGLRVQAAAMAMGQVAGVVAHLAAASGCDLDEVDLDAARDLLRRHGAIVPEPALASA